MVLLYYTNNWLFYSTERTCPDDCTDSSQGTCDTSNGKCTCEQGFEGNNCAGQNYSFYIIWIRVTWF